MDPKVSILLPTYKRADYLREAIASALAQTHRNIELLVLDDASPDHTPRVVAEFESDSRLRYLRHPKNLGITGNWAAGIEALTGDYFCILHDDDTFEPEFVETLIAPLTADPGSILAFCDHWMMDQDGKRLSEEPDENSRRFHRHNLSPGVLADFARSALIDVSIPVGATMFRAGCVTPEFISERARGSIDIWLFYQCVKTQMRAFYVPTRLMNYRQHGGGMSQSASLYMHEGHVYRFEAMIADPQLAHLRPVIEREMSRVLSNYGFELLVAGRRAEARSSFKRSLSLRKSKKSACAYGLACGGGLGSRAAAVLQRLNAAPGRH
jgi:glycosyltransferase involved in cell wall biosynthesis